MKRYLPLAFLATLGAFAFVVLPHVASGEPKQAIGKMYTDVDFSFAPAGTGAVSASSIRGEGITSVTRSDVGVFAVVLDDPIYEVIDFKPSVQLNTDADVTVSSWNYATSTRTLTMRVRSGGSAADISAHASNRLGGCLTGRRSSVGK
jgi:hypothetical protein